MAAGLLRTPDQINPRVGALALTIRQWCTDMDNMKVLILDDLGHDGLVALGIKDPDATQIVAAVTSMYALAQIARGQGTQAQANDFFYDARHLTGVL